jgi:hypothetical protein
MIVGVNKGLSNNEGSVGESEGEGDLHESENSSKSVLLRGSSLSFHSEFPSPSSRPSHPPSP